MAVTKTFRAPSTGSIYGSRYMTLKIEEQNVSIENNTSDVKWTLTVSGDTYYYDTGVEITINGTKVYAKEVGWNDGFPAKPGSTSGTVTGIKHDDATGAKTINVSFKAYVYVYSYKQYGGDVELETIPRITECPNLDGYIESGATIALNPASTTFKHRLYYEYENANTNDVKTGVYPSATGFFGNVGTLPLDTTFYSYTPKAIGTGKLTLYTYTSDGTNIGSSSGTITIRCDKEKCKPTISATVIDSNATTANLTAGATTSSILVKGYSTARITYTINPRNSASISSKTVNGSALSASPHEINNVSTNSFKIVAIDSRGFDTTDTKTNSMVNYVPLTLSFEAYRPTPTGSEIRVRFEGDYFNSSFGKVANTLSLSWKYRVKGASSWTDGGTFTKDTHYTISGNRFVNKGDYVSLSTSLFAYTNNYEIAIYYSDKLVNTSTAKAVPKGQPVIYWEDGKAGVNGTFTASSTATVGSLSSSGAVSGTNITGSGTVKGATVNATSNLQINGTNVLLKAYPVGSIYMSVNSTNPGTLFGGTWTQLKDRFLLGAGDSYSNGATGGSATHTLTVAEMPSHSHGFMAKKDGNYGSSSHWRPTTSGGEYSGYVTATGGGGAHNNMPPYLVVYMWKRTA